MYSWEISQMLQDKNYIITSDDYIKICKSSQVSIIKYEPHGSYFEVWTDDGYYWKFTLKREDE